MHNLGEKNRERPLYYKYSLKARALIHAHLWRIPLNPETLDIDRIIVIQKCPHLIQEMINCIAQLILLAYAQRGINEINKVVISVILNSFTFTPQLCFSSTFIKYRNARKLYEIMSHGCSSIMGV